MIGHGDKVRYRMTGETGTVVGIMHMNTDNKKMLVKFDIKNELWINEVDLEECDDRDDN